MHENDGKQLSDQILAKEFYNKKNYFFENIKLSFPLKENSTQFGHYYVVEKDVEIHYTREKQLIIK